VFKKKTGFNEEDYQRSYVMVEEFLDSNENVDREKFQDLLMKLVWYFRSSYKYADPKDRVRLRLYFNLVMDGEDGMDTILVTKERAAEIEKAVEWYDNRPRRERRARR
jgi:CRISPR/Cas system type I-B associated protein Csh2 (Cas7 group RAMP superfamily)